jgi:hypothetical protein
VRGWLSAAGFFAAAVAGVAAVPAASSHANREQARIVVAATGFGQDEDPRELGAGFVLKNATSLDALGVEVTINVVGSGGRLIGGDSVNFTLIPAHTVFYGGADVFPHGRAVRLEVYTQVDHWVRHRYHLPVVRNVRFVVDAAGEGTVTGEVFNNLRGRLSQSAHIGIVLVGHNGSIVGGGFTFPDNDIPPGRRILFESVSGPGATRPSRIAYARASMDNDNGLLDPVPG